MTSTTDSTDLGTRAHLDAEQYLSDVAPHLAALPADERADLLDDLAQHLQEIAAEPGPPLAERLGPPEAYAAELLASAGVEVGAPSDQTVRARATALAARARRSWVGQEALRLAPALRPAWWVLRAYLVVSLLDRLHGDGSPAFPLPQVAGSTLAGLVALAAAVAVSVRLGQRVLPRGGRLLVAGANTALALYALSLADGADLTRIHYVESSRPPTAALRGCLATASGQPVTNLYAYDSEGRLLDPVLLFDQDGQPIDNLCPELDSWGRRLFTEYGQDVNGAPVINAFPRRQTAAAEPGRVPFPGQTVPTVPVRPPAVVVPRLAPATTVTTAPG